MILLEEFFYYPMCGGMMGYTSRSIGGPGLFMIDWRGSEGYPFSEWPGRDRNHWCQVS